MVLNGIRAIQADGILSDEATAVLDGSPQPTVLQKLFEKFKRRFLIWLVRHASLGKGFDHAVIQERGKLLEQGPFSESHCPN